MGAVLVCRCNRGRSHKSSMHTVKPIFIVLSCVLFWNVDARKISIYLLIISRFPSTIKIRSALISFVAYVAMEWYIRTENRKTRVVLLSFTISCRGWFVLSLLLHVKACLNPECRSVWGFTNCCGAQACEIVPNAKWLLSNNALSRT